MNTSKTTENATTTTLEIMNGPSKSTLCDAFKYAHDEQSIVVKFSIARGYTMPEGHPGRAYIPLKISGITITKLEYEDGSGYHLNLGGYCSTDLSLQGDKPSRHDFVAYYDVRTRKGNIKFSN